MSHDYGKDFLLYGLTGKVPGEPMSPHEVAAFQRIHHATVKEMTMSTQDQLDNWFKYHAPEGDESRRYEQIRAAGKVFAEKIVELCPASADRTSAIRKIREAVATANASIACKGK